MARKKKSNLKVYLTCIFILLILVGLFWGEDSAGEEVQSVGKTEQSVDKVERNIDKVEQNTGETVTINTSYIDSLQIVKYPSELPSQLLEYVGFTVNFNPQMHQPNYVAWELTSDEAYANKVKRNDSFEVDPNVKTCATLHDYRSSGYSRGHMAPAADMKWSSEAMDDCFLLTNITPQKSELNEGAWKSVEDKCRVWAKRDSSLIIICGPILSDHLTRSIGQTPVPVPERFFKVILAPHANPIRAIAFIMNNGYVEGGMQAAAVSVDEVEQVTGLDFFSSLPDDIENDIEAECNFPLWSRKR